MIQGFQGLYKRNPHIVDLTEKMRIHPVQIGNIEATAIEDIPLGSICIAPMVQDEGIPLSESERILIVNKATLLSNFLQDEQFLEDVASLYEDPLNLPPLLVLFNRFDPDEHGSGFHGNTSDQIININGYEGRIIELNFLDADEQVRDMDRLFYLWSGFFSLAMCHSPFRPDDIENVVKWSESEVRRSWLLAINRDKILNPRKKYVMGVERSYIHRARPIPFDPSHGTLLFTFPLHFKSAEEYRRRYNREFEHLFPEPDFDDILDFSHFPPWRWNNTAGFIDVYETQDRGLHADINIATTYRKMIRHRSIEPARASVSSKKIFRFFNNIKWEKAFLSGNCNDKLELFLDLIETYIKSVFNWECNVIQLRSLVHKIRI